MKTPETCPNCGADVPPNARACPECGSDEQTGWSEEAEAGGLDLPDENFNYDQFVEKEFGAKKPIPHGIRPFWWVIALMILAGLLYFLIR